MRIAIVLVLSCLGVARADTWPAYLVSTGETPFVTESPSMSDGLLGAHIPFEVVSETDANVTIHVTGTLEAWGSIARDHVGALVCTPTSLAGRPVLLDEGDVVSLRSKIDAGRVEIRAYVPSLLDPPPAFDGVLPASALCAHATPQARRGTAVPTVHNKAIDFADKPHGKIVFTLKATTWGWAVRVLEQKRGSSHVIAGDGPAIEGWVNSALLEKNAGDIFGGVGLPTVPDALVADRWRRTPGGVPPMYRVAAGTEVVAGGRRVAVLHGRGFARVLSRHVDGVTVAVAVDNDLMVFGSVPAASIGAVVTSESGPQL